MIIPETARIKIINELMQKDMSDIYEYSDEIRSEEDRRVNFLKGYYAEYIALRELGSSLETRNEWLELIKEKGPFPLDFVIGTVGYEVKQYYHIKKSFANENKYMKNPPWDYLVLVEMDKMRISFDDINIAGKVRSVIPARVYLDNRSVTRGKIDLPNGIKNGEEYRHKRSIT